MSRSSGTSQKFLEFLELRTNAQVDEFIPNAHHHATKYVWFHGQLDLQALTRLRKLLQCISQRRFVFLDKRLNKKL